MNDITPEQKKRRFRELAKQDRIRTARELAEALEQPFLPLFNDCPPLINDVVTDVETFNAQAEKELEAARAAGFTGVILPGGRIRRQK